MTADVQLGLDHEVRAQILDRVLENASDDWKASALKAIGKLAATGREFQAHDLIALGVAEPDHPSRWGGILAHAHKIGLVEQAGWARSQRSTVRGSATMTWRGKDAPEPPVTRLPEIRALSMHRPYAALILAGVKTVENRGWTTKYRGPLVVHAAKKVATVPERLRKKEFLPTPYLLTVAMLPQLQPTGFVGVADLYDICDVAIAKPWDENPCDCGPWALPNSYHWRLRTPVILQKPITANGRQGLFHPPLIVADMARFVSNARYEATA